MSVNGVNGYSQLNAYNTYNTTRKTNKANVSDEKNTEASSNNTNESGVVFEMSEEAKSMSKSKSVVYKSNTALVNQLKADQESMKQSMLDMVKEAIGGQRNALATADDMWKFLASGNYTVSAATKADAKEAISENGFWGVKQTSDRIYQMAEALTGGDPKKMEEMREAFKKGFDDATKTWGKKLPDISSQTYDAVMKKFDDYAEQFNND